MPLLGLTSAPEESEGVLKSLFWPSVRNVHDAELMATRGFWICLILGVETVLLMVWRHPISASFYGLFYIMGAMGVRQGSLAASIGVFTIYCLEAIFAAITPAGHIGFVQVVIVGILAANLRAASQVHRWQSHAEVTDALDFAPERMNETWRDKLVDQSPRVIWPWGRVVFYGLFPVFLILEFLGFWVEMAHRVH
jgi:hypothetical protein